jgi:hypothetical protein
LCDRGKNYEVYYTISELTEVPQIWSVTNALASQQRITVPDRLSFEDNDTARLRSSGGDVSSRVKAEGEALHLPPANIDESTVYPA